MATFGSVLDNKAIAQLAIDHGFPTGDKQNLVTCVAIAQAESGGNVRAINQNTNGTADKGVWQINDVHNAKLPGQDRYDPNVNAELMMQISSGGTNWQPWSTYNSGAYQKFTGQVAKDIGATDFKPDPSGKSNIGGLGLDDVLDGDSSVASMVKFFNALTDIKMWIRVGEVILGGALIAFGLLMLLKDSSRVKQAVQVGLMAATKGKVPAEGG